MGSMDRKQGKARPEARTAFQPHPLHQTSTHMLRGERSALASQLGSRGMKCPRRLLKVWLELGEWDMAEMGSVGSGRAGTWFVGGSSWGMRRVHPRWSPGVELSVQLAGDSAHHTRTGSLFIGGEVESSPSRGLAAGGLLLAACWPGMLELWTRWGKSRAHDLNTAPDPRRHGIDANLGEPAPGSELWWEGRSSP
ncbi:hypothetical protein JHW43_000078 [Diplocarpon mali]|nr:hypothetical protein JHW43_000078 [Diplocarpon mali]